MTQPNAIAYMPFAAPGGMQSADVYAHHMGSLLIKGGDACRTWQALNRDMFAIGSRIWSDWMGIPREAASCRTPGDLSCVQVGALQRAAQGYFTAANALFDAYFEALSGALEMPRPEGAPTGRQRKTAS